MAAHSGHTSPEKPAQLALPERVIVDGPVPKHAQLRDILEDFCANELSPGDLLPGERVIEDHFDVSRITVRRAIGDLVAAGKLRRVRGKGTFVAPQSLVSRMHLASFSAEMKASGVDASSRILLSERAAPPLHVANFFNAEQTRPQIHLRRLRLGNGSSYSVDDAWYNTAVVPGLLENDIYRSVYEILDEKYHYPITSADQTVTARNASEEEAALLDVEPGAALLHIIRRSVSNEQPVEYCSSLYRTDRYSLRTRVEAPHDDLSR